MIALKLRQVLRMMAASTAMFGALLASAPAHADETRLLDTSSGKVLAVAVGPQYDTTHVCVAPEDFDRFTDSFVATFGGKKSQQGVFQVTPTPSQTMSQLVLTPVGTISVFGFKT
ncbi:glyoxalase, partial [Burkholderia sp. USMB20]